MNLLPAAWPTFSVLLISHDLLRQQSRLIQTEEPHSKKDILSCTYNTSLPALMPVALRLPTYLPTSRLYSPPACLRTTSPLLLPCLHYATAPMPRTVPSPCLLTHTPPPPIPAEEERADMGVSRHS